MADVARILPRHWDGPRLLRFLTGLALLALAFAVHAGPATTAPVTEAPATTVTTATVTTAVTTTVDAPAPVAKPVTPATPGESSAPARAPRFAGTIVLAGAHPGVHGSRGPPLA